MLKEIMKKDKNIDAINVNTMEQEMLFIKAGEEVEIIEAEQLSLETKFKYNGNEYISLNGCL